MNAHKTDTFHEIMKKTVNHFTSLILSIDVSKTESEIQFKITPECLPVNFSKCSTKTFCHHYTWMWFISWMVNDTILLVSASVCFYGFMSQWIALMMMNFSRQALCHTVSIIPHFVCFKKFSLHLLLDFTGNKLHKTFNISS